MRKVAWIVHYRYESDIFEMNDFNWRNKNLKRLFFEINSRFSPYVSNNFINHELGIDYFVIICPILGAALAVLKKEKQLKMLKKALMLANKLKIDQIGLAGVLASIGENPKEFMNVTKTPITTSKNLICSLAFEYISQACNSLKKEMKNCTLGIIGSNNSVSKVMLEYYTDKFKMIMLDKEDGKSRKYDNVQKNSLDKIFGVSDVIIVNAMGFGLAGYIDIIKPGSIVCDLMVPFYLTNEINNKRRDILAFEGVWARYAELSNYKDKKGKVMTLFPDQMLPACVAEPLVLTLGKKLCYFSAEGDINYSKSVLIDKMRKEFGLDFIGFKQRNFIYSAKDLERIKNAAQG
jgi:predicted amino acid dehydrogenase